MPVVLNPFLYFHQTVFYVCKVCYGRIQFRLDVVHGSLVGFVGNGFLQIGTQAVDLAFQLSLLLLKVALGLIQIAFYSIYLCDQFADLRTQFADFGDVVLCDGCLECSHGFL